MKKTSGLKPVLLIQTLNLLMYLLKYMEGGHQLYVYNICCQHSKLKYTKQNLKENEGIFSVNFCKNYENKQKNEIQSAYFWP